LAIEGSRVVAVTGSPGSLPEFSEYYEKYYPALLKHAAYLTGNITVAEDVVQEAFARLLNLSGDHSNVRAWLYTVVIHLSYNYLRSEKGKRTKEPLNGAETGNVVSLEDLALRNAEIRLTQRILGLMNARDRICLLLKFSGYKYHEIAAALELKKASVGKILARAQEKFKELYLKEVRER
jgi:RNA polymerase sigma factor (sigma-70 family)